MKSNQNYTLDQMYPRSNVPSIKCTLAAGTWYVVMKRGSKVEFTEQFIDISVLIACYSIIRIHADHDRQVKNLYGLTVSLSDCFFILYAATLTPPR